MKFDLPFATPSNNAVMRMHHRARTKSHQEYYLVVAQESGALSRNIETFESCRVIVIRHGSRFLDWDNFGGGLKFLLDAMVKIKIIKDDNPNCIVSLDLYQVKCKRKDEKTVVEVLETINLEVG